MAVEDGGLDLDKVEKRRFGVVVRSAFDGVVTLTLTLTPTPNPNPNEVGSAFGGMETFEKQVLQLDKGKKISPFAIPQLLGRTVCSIRTTCSKCT